MTTDTKIFLLDDEKIVCEFIAHSFKDQYDFTYFTKEEDCAKALISEKPDFLLLDYYLAEMNGLDFYEENKMLLEGIEIVFISGQKSITDMFGVINQTKAKFVVKDENMLKCLEYLFIGDLEAYENLLY